MANKEKRKNELRRETLGEMFMGVGAIPEWVRIARERQAQGEDDETIKSDVRALAHRDGFSVSRFLLPSVNRKARRLNLLKVGRALLQHYSKHGNLRSLGDFLDRVADAIGFDEWLANGVVEMARTGQAPRFLDMVTGRVWVQPKGLHGEDEPSVWAVATSFTNARERADEFYDKCKEVFPEGSHTWSKTSQNPEGARYCRLRIQGLTDTQIAEREMGPEELARLDAQGTAIRKYRVAEEADRIRKARTRFWEYLDTLPEELSG